MSRFSRSLLLVPALLLAAGRVAAQCMLANPSFEVGGQAGAVFGGWNGFGSVGSSTVASHGKVAARVSGPNTGNWDVSGYWQPQTSVAGDRWDVTGTVRIPSTRPLAGQSKAIVNVEWRNAAAALISFESHDVATAASPNDSTLTFAFTTAAAPAGTASARLLLGVLQGPGDPQRDALYDRITFERQTTPSLDTKQWDDFAGGRTLSFAGRTWRVKGPGFYGPGPSSFSNSASAVFTDANGRLHLTIAPVGNTWFSTEVALNDPLGYGDYVFTTRGRLDTFDPTTVFGLYIWEYGPCYDPAYLWWNPYNECDVEFSRWGVPSGTNAQFVCQPFDWAGNLHAFSMAFAADEVTSHAFRWRPDRIEFRSWRGGPAAESPGTLVRSWTYTGPHIPRPDQPRVHLNLWQFQGAPATPQEAVLDGFQFTPWPTPVLDAPGPRSTDPLSLAILGAMPARGGASFEFQLNASRQASLVIHDVAGRRVRTLVTGLQPAGRHRTSWDGLDDAGRPAAPGIYLVRLEAAGEALSRRLVFLR